MDERKIADLDCALVAAARHVRVLGSLAWQAGSEKQFLSSWHKGSPALPETPQQPPRRCRFYRRLQVFPRRRPVGGGSVAPLFDSGWLKPPRFLPHWAVDLRRIAALMAYSAFVANIDLQKVTLQRMLELEQKLAGPPVRIPGEKPG